MNFGKIKILVVEPIADLGGVSQYIFSLVGNLSGNKFEIHIAASGSKKWAELAERDNIIVHDLKIDYSIFSIIYAIISFRIFLKKERFDLIHAHTAKAGLLCNIANKNLNTPIIYTGHGFRFNQKNFFIIKTLFFYIEKFIYDSSSFVTVLSKIEYNFGISKGLLASEKTKIISMSIDVARFSEDVHKNFLEQRMKYSIGKKTFVVGMLGRMTFQKDPETFIHAARIIKEKITNVSFVWVGDGDLKEKITQSAHRFGLKNNLIITGQQEAKDIPKLLSIIDVLLFTSKYEGLPIAILEAMAAKKKLLHPELEVLKNSLWMVLQVGYLILEILRKQLQLWK